jgi:superoxide dismutase, Cu-Zn family
MRVIKYLLLLSIIVLLAGCTARDQEKWQEKQDNYILTENIPNYTEAVAVLHPTEGSRVKGIVRFKREGNGVSISAEIEGLAPNKKHGFHVHQYGDCSAPDASSAGDHFNPFDYSHGAPDDDNVHSGDLGNLESDSEGRATYSANFGHLALWGAASVIGRAVVVHENEDDLTSQPTGNAGKRIACGTIGGIDSSSPRVSNETQNPDKNE